MKGMDLIHRFFNIVLPPLNIILLVCFLPLYLVFKFAYCLKRHMFIENVAGKVVLVTGAASGIGEQIAYEYAKRRACLVLVDIREDRLGPVAEKAKFLGSPDVLAIGADVSKLQDSQRFIEAAVDHFGKLDHLVNNAGTEAYFQIGVSDPKMLTPATSQIHNVMDVNFWGTVYSTHFALQHLIKSKGKIIVIASGLGRYPFPILNFYCASKAAAISLYESLRSEIGSDIGITIVTPGLIESEMSGSMEKGGLDFIIPKESKEACAKAIVRSACRGDKYLTEPSWIRVLFLWKFFYPEVVEFGNHWAIYRRFLYLNKTSTTLSPSPQLKLD